MEKPVLQCFLTTFLLLSPALASASASSTRPPAVHDVAGSPLLRGDKYYVLPAVRGRGGGLTLAGRNGSTCPLSVAQEGSEAASGLPLTFRPVDPTETAVRRSTDLNVAFAAATVCVQPTLWRLGGVDEATGRRYVGTGGVAGRPGPATVSNWFKIEEAAEEAGKDRYYKLVFCPSVCLFCKVVCGDVGVFYEDGRWWLGLSEVPFPVMFKRAT